MTITLRRSPEHFHSNLGWLDTRHHFSFNEYYDPQNLNWASLRVFNDDVIQPSEGFPFHSHSDMEIVTYVLSGELTHEDSLGNKGQIVPGMVQYMCAGTGIRHAEYNASKTTPAHLLQMWVLPPKRGLAPSWSEKKWEKSAFENTLQLLASPTGKDNSLHMHQKASFYASHLNKGKSLKFTPEQSHQYLFVVEGILRLNTHTLESGDVARIRDEKMLSFTAEKNTHFVVWDFSDGH